MPEVILTGPDGRIEGRYHQNEKSTAPCALVLHPHPMHGGTMNNKVVYNIYHSFIAMGFSVLRINFPGVGRSEGSFDNGIGELSVAATVMDWLQNKNQNASSFWVGGFSFGAWIAMQLLMRRPEIEGFISVSPPVNMYDFSFLAPCPSAGLVLQGDQDSVVDVDSVTSFVEKLSKQRNTQVDYCVIPGADHFFRGETMDDLNAYIKKYIAVKLVDLAQPKKRIKPDRRRRQLPVS